MATSRLAALGRLLRLLVPPLILAALVVFALREPMTWWLRGEEIYDQEAIKEWIREARVQGASNLPELIKSYLELASRHTRIVMDMQDLQDDRRDALRGDLHEIQQRQAIKRGEILEHLKSMGTPPTKMYAGQLPLFPIIYRLTVQFPESWDLPAIVWDSELPRQTNQYRELKDEPIHADATVTVQYHLHAFMQRQFKEREEVTRRFWLSGLGILFALLVVVWIYVAQRRDRERQQHRLLAEQQLNEAQRRSLEEELRRQEAERKHDEVERQNLELKSQLFANIGIMAGSYAHNIKNLLVRPNDLLRRCLEEEPAGHDRATMLKEVKQTLGTVTQRLQQILHTVRRDPSQSEMVKLDLNAMVHDLHATWTDLAREKWKLTLEIHLDGEPGSQGKGEMGVATGDRRASPLWIEGDLSHLQQALENLLFNARDATFEMRNRLRDQARANGPDERAPLDPERRQALIAAAGWRGQVVLRTRPDGDQAILEIQDNGIGMSEEVRRRCTDTHFSTKRDNALFAGLTAGMGLGLSFVQVILDHHRAQLEIESKPGEGSLFRIRFPRVV